ncbi:CoA transferase [Pseudonocardia sp. RS010]|uniref:CaiB/BaiF CoA-transferase family protein n=1 Tax=Pseudonocardia sp. RS010 TaxID=3385979 RepID=UPI0039A3E4A3
MSRRHIGLGREGSSSGLAAVRVLEIADGVAVAWAAKLFADLGADVLRVEEPNDRVRQRPFDVHRWLNTNKRSVRRDGGFAALLAGADVVIHGLAAADAQAAGLDHATLSTIAPRLVVCALTPWGSTGPYAGFRGEELSVIHGSSWGFLSPAGATRVELPPLKAPGHHAMINVATSAATATLAAFDGALRTGQGEYIDFSMFGAAAKMTEFAPAKATFLGKDASRLGSKSVIPWGIYRCTDGLVQVLCPEEDQWRAFRAMMGDPEWAHLDVFDSAETRWRNPDVVDFYLAEWFSTQTVADVTDAAQKVGVCLTPVNSVSQFAEDPHVTERGFVVEDPTGLRLPGAPYRFDKPWFGIRTAAPDLWANDGEGWRDDPASFVDEGTDEPAPSSAPHGRPLEGIRVCDFTWVWAGPFCTQELAHLGADVIRMESPSRPDYYRRAPLHPKGVTRSLNTSGVFHMYNTDKRSVAIDLRHPDAREVVLDLVRHCDVVVDNFSVGVMNELGLGVADLRAANPSVIVASLSGYGQTGPKSHYKAYGSAAAAITGLDAANGYEPGDVLEPGLSIGDPGTGLAAAWAIVAAVVARRCSGEAAVIDVAMVEAVAATVGELWMEQVATGQDPAPRANRDPGWAPHGCYPASGEDRWITIACTSEDEWQALCGVIDPRLADDPRFRTVDDRRRHEDELDAIVSAWTQAQDRWQTCERLQAVGVPAFPSLSPLELWSGDPQLAAIGMIDVMEHPATGSFALPGVPWRLANGPNGLRAPAPLLGQHTDDVMSELNGYDSEAIARLRGSGVLPLAQ